MAGDLDPFTIGQVSDMGRDIDPFNDALAVGHGDISVIPLTLQ